MESMNLLWLEYVLLQFMCQNVNSLRSYIVQQHPTGGVWATGLELLAMGQCLLWFQCDLSLKYS